MSTRPWSCPSCRCWERKRCAMPDETDLSIPEAGSLQRGRFTYFPGATGKYVKRPRWRLPASGIERSVSSGIAQRFLSQHLHDGQLQGLVLMRPLGGQALQLNGEAGHV